MSPEFIERQEFNYVQGELGDRGQRINTVPLPANHRPAIQVIIKPTLTSIHPFKVPANPRRRSFGDAASSDSETYP